MREKISVIIPYWNESTTIHNTLLALAAQNYKPFEVILVDSGSGDDSFQKINNWIGTYSGPVKFVNLPAKTGFPSSSRNVGASKATGDYLAFMDCGLNFAREWLESQLHFLTESGLRIVSLGCVLKGEGLVDVAAVSQTYGYDRPRLVIPGTLMETSVFREVGPFLERRRSGDDVDWANKLSSKGITRGFNSQVKVQYLGTNYARTLGGLFKKVRTYGRDSVFLHGYYWPLVYLVSAFAGVLTSFFYPALIIYLGLLYIALRGYGVPVLKSHNLRFFREGPGLLLLLPLAGFVIDIAKVCSYLEGYFYYGKRGWSSQFSNDAESE